MNLEIKIVRIVLLISIFFGLFNLTGQFGSFLTPFIFNYITVSVVGIVFSIRNYGHKDFIPLLFFSLSSVLITLASGQFTYVLNLFSHSRIIFQVSDKWLLIGFIAFWLTLIYMEVKLLLLNSKSKIIWFQAFQFIILLAYILLYLFSHDFSNYFFLFYSFLITANLILSDFKSTPGLIRIIYLIFLNASLELLKLISIIYLQ